MAFFVTLIYTIAGQGDNIGDTGPSEGEEQPADAIQCAAEAAHIFCAAI
jgi:hypothetical protein